MDKSKQAKTFPVEVIYALPDQQKLLKVELQEGQTARDAIELSGVLTRYPELNIESMVIGLFGKKTKMDQKLRSRDRVEIYRPLIADPKEVRKRKAAEGKKLKKGGASNTAKAAKA